MGKELINIAEKAVQKAISQGVSAAEVYLARNKDLTIEVSDQKVETMKLADEKGLGMRLFHNGKLGFAYTSDLSETALEQVVLQAVSNSESTVADDYNILPEPSSFYPELSLYDPTINQISLEKKIELAKEIERTAREYDPRVKITKKCAYTDSVYEVAIFNSLGIKGSYQGAYCGAYSFLVAEENSASETGFGFQYKLRYDDIDPRLVAVESAQKAVRMLGAKSISTQEMIAVFDPYVAVGFLGLISPSLSANSVQKGKSKFSDRKGQQVSSEFLTLIDDGVMGEKIMSAPFDGEGVPCQKTVLIHQGILKGFLYNTYTAKKDNTESTGNGTRSYKGIPEIGTSNFYIEKGTISKDEMLKQISKGIYITEVMGMHTANHISGDFSVGAAGLLIENGELTKPVRGIAIAGNIFDLLFSIDKVASDLTFFIGKGSPSLQVSQMVISGD
ncbi:MAG: TldD/PmbA family protein [Bacillota bacterium]|jgi:PmbA protein